MVDDITALRARITPILNAVGNNLRMAIALAEVNRLPSFDPTIIGKFDNTLAAHVLDLNRSQLSLSTVAALARVWDRKEDTQSISNLAEYLRDPRIVDLVACDRREQMLAISQYSPMTEGAGADPDIVRWVRDMAERDAAQAEELIRKGAQKAVNMIDEFLASPLRASLGVARDRLIAHALEMTRAERRALERGETIAPLQRGDLETITDFTVDVATEVEAIFRGNHPNLAQFRTVWRRNAEDFWTRISPEPKGRPRRDAH